jgi:surfeit locus 1 family protein
MRRYAFPLLLGIAGCAILVSLGVWQLQRLEWKRGVLAEIEARIGGAPVALPGPGEVARDPEAWRYLPVEIVGHMTGEDLLVMSGMKDVGPGFQLVSVVETDDGRRIMADLGFLPDALRREGRAGGNVTIRGNLHWPREVSSSTPTPEEAERLWFARDVPSMAAFLKAEELLVVASAVEPPVPGVVPVPIDTRGIPNDHQNYAITWFSLAVVWAGMTVYLLSRIRRKTI